MACQEDELLLQVQWLRNVSSEECRGDADEGIAAREASRFPSYRLPNVPFADRKWIKREIGPSLISSCLRKFARVLTEDVFNYISFENLLQRITGEHKAKTEVGQFTSVEAALAWIRMDWYGRESTFILQPKKAEAIQQVRQFLKFVRYVRSVI